MRSHQFRPWSSRGHVRGSGFRVVVAVTGAVGVIALAGTGFAGTPGGEKGAPAGVASHDLVGDTAMTALGSAQQGAAASDDPLPLQPPAATARDSGVTGKPVTGRPVTSSDYRKRPGELDYGTFKIGNTFQVNKDYTHVQNFINAAVVDAAGCVDTDSHWDEGGSRRGRYCIDGSTEMRDQDKGPDIDNQRVSVGASAYTIKAGQVHGPAGRLKGVKRATALGLDRLNGTLMVADDAPGEHLVKFFDNRGALVRTLGRRGGLRATLGRVTPTTFWGMTGVGSDRKGNLCVVGSQNGSWIRCFDPSGRTVLREYYGLPFSDAADFDRSTNGSVVYGPHEIYDVDLSKPRDPWKLRCITMDVDAHPGDVRNPAIDVDAQAAPLTTWYRRINGRRFLFTTSMTNAGGIHAFAFRDGDGCIASPAGHVDNERIGGRTGDLNVLPNGDVMYAGSGDLRTLKAKITARGDVAWGPATTTAVPALFTNVQEIDYDRGADRMCLGGGTPEHPTEGDSHGAPVVACYKAWSGRRTLISRTIVPFVHNENPNVGDRNVPIELSCTGRYCFHAYVNRTNSPVPGGIRDGESGEILVTRISDGKRVGMMLPQGGGTTGGWGKMGSWIDLSSGGIKAICGSDGVYRVLREENWMGSNIIYAWNPDNRHC